MRLCRYARRDADALRDRQERLRWAAEAREDLPAMILSALLVLLPAAALTIVLLALCTLLPFGCGG